MALKIRRWWNQRRFGQRLALLIGLAALAALLTETLLNARALTTLSLTPVPVAVQALTLSADVPVTVDEDGVHVDQAANRTVDLTLSEPGVPLSTVMVTLRGKGVVNVALLIKDQASAYTAEQVYNAYCVADDPALSTCYATVESAGTARELCVRVKALGNDPYTVSAVTLNAPVPFVLQPLRAALAFAVALALLCGFLLRGFDAVYRPGRLSHRLIVAVPLAALMGLALCVSLWIEPTVPLFSGVTDADAASSQTDIYAVLYENLSAGRLAVDRTPDAAFLSLENPYDQSERVTKQISFPFDYAYYRGRYYIYYGVAPVLTLYAPFHAVTGRVPDSRDATLLMGWITIAGIGWAVCGAAARYARDANVFALSLCCVTAVFASGAMLLIASADFYYLAELSFVGYCAGAIGFGLHAAAQKRGWLRVTQYTLCGVCFVLAAMSRPSGMPMLVAFLAPLFLCELLLRRAKLREAAAFLTPVLLGAGLLMAYNAARFGSVLDFGARHQLTVTDVHWRGVRLLELPQALYHYLIEPGTWSNRFPYLSVGYHASPTAGRYVFTLSSIGVLAFPITWALALYPLAARYDTWTERSLRRERTLTLWLPLLVSLPLMLVSYGMAGTILRYTCDFRLFYVLAAVMCALPLLSGGGTPERRAIALLCVCACAASLFVGVALMFDNERDNILKNAPQIYYGLQRMFFPY